MSQSKNWFLGGQFWGGFREVAPPNYVKIFVSKISTADIKKHWHRILSRSKNWFWGDLWGGRYPQTTSKYLYLKYLLTAKNTGTRAWAIHKIGFRAVRLEGGLSEVVPPNSVEIFASKYLLIWKYTGTVNKVVQKIGFWGSILGGPQGGLAPPNYVKMFVS